MKCLHCNREYNDEYDFCPFCAEPKPKPAEKELTPEETVRKHDQDIGCFYCFFPFFAWIPMYIFVYVLMFINHLSKGTDEPLNGWMIAFWNTLIVVGASIVLYLLEKSKSPREKIISVQFKEDQTSICPRCGSHDIALGSKGYDWNKAWWGEVIGNDAAKYDAGAESRRVTAHCKHCGNDWLTDREWIN